MEKEVPNSGTTNAALPYGCHLPKSAVKASHAPFGGACKSENQASTFFTAKHLQRRWPRISAAPMQLTFKDLEGSLQTYHRSIKKKQREGRYATADYAFGAMLAFEAAKRLIKDGDEDRFVGNFNLLPHVKWRMRQFDWVERLMHLSYFSGLISEECTTKVTPMLRRLAARQEVLDQLFEYIVKTSCRVGSESRIFGRQGRCCIFAAR